MAELLFKRGLHTALPTGSDVIDGAFYLTTDSHRLYAGIGSELVDLNQYIHIAETLSELNSLTDVQTGDFAYIKAENILAIKLEGAATWQQINSNTFIEQINITHDNAKDPGIVNFVLTDNEGNAIQHSFLVTGSNGVDVYTETLVNENGEKVDPSGRVLGANENPYTQIVIQGNTYELGTDLDTVTGVFSVTLSPSDTDDDNSVSTKFSLTQGNNVIFEKTSEGLKISAQDTQLLSGTNGGTFSADNLGGAIVTIEDTAGNQAQAVAPANSFYYTVGKTSKTSIANQNELPVYTIAEIDSMMTALNPMSYKGTVAILEFLEGLTGVQAGDTYMASSNFDISSITGNLGQSCKTGDLFIATGEEDDDGFLTTVTWTYVPSGDDSQTDTQYYAVPDVVKHILTIYDTNGNIMTVLDFDNTDGKITLTSTGYGTAGSENGLILSIDHAAPGADDATKKKTNPIITDCDIVTAITGIEVDETGHIASYTITQHNILKYTLNNAVLKEESTNLVSVTTTLEDAVGNMAGQSIFQIDTTASDNLNVTVDGDKIILKLEWGTF